MADWYAKSMDGIAAWWAKFVTQRPNFETKYPILQTKKSELDAIGQWVAYWVPARHAADGHDQQMSEYWATISGNDPSKPPPDPVTYTLPGSKPAEVPPGVEKFIRDIRREVKNSGNYAAADGEAMGFEAATTSIDIGSLKPGVKTFGAVSGNLISVVVNGRADSDQWTVKARAVGSTDWVTLGTFTGKSADVTWTGTTSTQIEIVVQLLLNNENYGQPSDPSIVTANP